MIASIFDGIVIKHEGQKSYYTYENPGSMTLEVLQREGQLVATTNDDEWDIHIYLHHGTYYSETFFNPPGNINRLECLLSGVSE